MENRTEIRTALAENFSAIQNLWNIDTFDEYVIKETDTFISIIWNKKDRKNEKFELRISNGKVLLFNDMNCFDICMAQKLEKTYFILGFHIPLLKINKLTLKSRIVNNYNRLAQIWLFPKNSEENYLYSITEHNNTFLLKWKNNKNELEFLKIEENKIIYSGTTFVENNLIFNLIKSYKILDIDFV